MRENTWRAGKVMNDRRIRVLGPLRVVIDGTPVDIRGRLPRTLLGRLVVAHGRVLSVDRLVDDIWEGKPPPSAASVLQVQIHKLRTVFEPRRHRRAPATVLVSEGGGYALRLAVEQVDAWHFEALLRVYQDRLRESGTGIDPADRCRLLDAALACWDGAALESFQDAGWAVGEADRLTDLRLLAAELRAQAALALDRPTEVVTGLRPLLDQRPGREEGARLLAIAQYRLGQQAEALATLRRAGEYLVREIGVYPGRRLRDLESAILNQKDPLQVGPTVHAIAETPAAGRDSALDPGPSGGAHTGYPRQFAAVLAAAAEAWARGARPIWLAGAAGMGKTYLAESVAAELRRRSWTVATGRCVDGGPPARAWADIAASLDGPAGFAESLSAARYFDVARTIAQRCRTVAAARPVALVLEDLQYADPVTLHILRLLTAWLRRAPVLLILTLRPAEAGPELRATVTALADRTVSWEELNGVGPDTVARMVRTAGGTAVDRDTIAALRERTGGNPLFVRELAGIAAQHGDIRELPPRVRDIVRARIERLPAEVIRTLRYAARLGDDADVAGLLALLGCSETALLDRITTAQAAGIIRFDPVGRIGFEHSLIREVLEYGFPEEWPTGERASPRQRESGR
ncbi:BTAD domain-containing putative transcriptional regulator [Nocardia otitidiscaviarum]|uniref:BTAD domain-containing putative transcriptional regulator n=1 Tax=Nocardia otitidiscaviarum TaxID=1823 RepID=UPI0018950015|nr:BTAD domain-containing putative transcriptional regulator [Nocardia otitidiscaviarum]MBF6177929.1 AAA family ATPase [Nocardia otitidiscaviarum]